MKKQFIAKLLVLALVLSTVPAAILSVSAAGEEDNTANTAASNGGYYDVYVDTTVRVNEPVSTDGTIEAKVVGGKATVILTNNAVESLTDLAKDGEITLEIKDEGATKLDVSYSAKLMTKVAKETGADLTIKSTVATITIPNDVLTNEFTNAGNVKISVQSSSNSMGFSIQASGRALKNIKGVKVEF